MAKKKELKLNLPQIKISFEEGERLKAICSNQSRDLGITLTLEQTAEWLMRGAIKDAKLPKS